jgi:hypothetical protein
MVIKAIVASINRSPQVASKIRTFFAAAGLVFAAATAQAGVINFDDLIPDPAASVYFPLSPYNGLTFATGVDQDWLYDNDLSRGYFPRSAGNYASSSPFAYPSYQCDPGTGLCSNVTTLASAPITSVADFVLSGAWFQGFGQGISFDLYNNGVKVFSSAVTTINDRGYTFVNAGYAGPIDEFRVNGFQGFFVMDDLTIPEPTSLALVALAAVAGFGASRTRRQAAVTAS